MRVRRGPSVYAFLFSKDISQLPTALTEQEGMNVLLECGQNESLFCSRQLTNFKKRDYHLVSIPTSVRTILFCPAFSNIAMKTRLRLQKVFYLILTYDKKAWIMNCTELLRTGMKLFHMRT